MKIAEDISMVVWLGCLALLFLAVAIHQGWFSSSASPILTSGTAGANNPSGPATSSQYVPGFDQGWWDGSMAALEGW